jgi:hypothetical protein
MQEDDYDAADEEIDDGEGAAAAAGPGPLPVDVEAKATPEGPASEVMQPHLHI